MASIGAGNIKKGDYILFRDQPCLVTSTEFMNPGKGSAIMRVRYKNLKTGNVVDFTYKTSEFVEQANVSRWDMQFLYQTDNEVYFMNPKTYDQVAVPMSLIEDKVKFLIPDMTCQTIWLDDEIIGIILPNNVVLTVTDAPEDVNKNRGSAPKKEVVTDTGLRVQTPLFVKKGDKIIVSTDSGEYISRAN